MKKLKIVLPLALMLFSCFSAQALATEQDQNASFRVENGADNVQNSKYSLSFNWVRPRISGQIDAALEEDGRFNDGRAEAYDFFMRNVSSNPPEIWENRNSGNPIGRVVDGDAPRTNYSVTFPDPAIFRDAARLREGSIYLFRIVPYHFHQIRRQNADGIWESIRMRAPSRQNVANSTTIEGTERAYLTDLGVWATGVGDTLTVTFDAPRWDGEEIFGYNIYYALAENVSSGGDLTNWGRPERFPLGDERLVYMPNGRIRVNIHSSDFEMGTPYAVRVEPTYFLGDDRPAAEQIRGMNNEKTSVNILRGTGATAMEYTLTFSRNPYQVETNVIFQPALDAIPKPDNMLWLDWGNPFRPIRIGGVDVSPNRIRLYEFEQDDLVFNDGVAVITGEPIRHLQGNFAREATYIPIARPNRIMHYCLEIEYLGRPMIISQVATYYPDEDTFFPYIPHILEDPVLTADGTYTVRWQAFAREPLADEIPNTTEGLYVDLGVQYKMVVVESMEEFRDLLSDDSWWLEEPPPPEGSLASLAMTPEWVRPSDITEGEPVNGRPTFYFERNFPGYAKRATRGSGFESQLQLLEANKVYYAMMVAIRPNAGARDAKVSQPAYYAWYAPVEGGVVTNPNVIARPPLRVQPESIDQTSFTLAWGTRWVEMYDENTKGWHSLIGVNSSGNIVFGEAAEALPNDQRVPLNQSRYYNNVENKPTSSDISRGRGFLYDDLQAKGASLPSIGVMPPTRYMDIEGVQYAIHVVNYDTMMNAGGYTDYLENELGFRSDTGQWFADTKDANWQTITPTEVVDSNILKEFRVMPLRPNTPYVVYFLPYNEVRTATGVEYRTASYPSYVTGTTDSERPPQTIEPPVPSLHLVDATSTTITVRWELLQAFQYELGYSPLLSQYPGGGTKIDHETLMADGRLTEEGFVEYDIPNMFPDTKYYIWIRIVESDVPSNPVLGQTKTLEPPLAPQGLGVASEDHVDIYNRENQTQFMPTDHDYLIVEWLRNYEDREILTGSGATEVTRATILDSEAFVATKMLKFNELQANRDYYVRAKTKRTLTRSGEENIEYYTYILQISRTEDFLDMTEVEVPQVTQTTDPLYTVVMESEWCDFIVLKTRPWSGEYDGDKNPSMYPLPTEDFEISYDRTSQTLTYRFLSDGANENLVDQRFITSLINQKAYSFYVDLSQDGTNPITKRVVDMPYSIWKAFDERQITLDILADNVAIRLNPNWANTAEIESLSDLGTKSRVRVTLTEQPQGLPLMPNTTNQSKAQRLSLDIQTPTRTQSLSYTATPIDIDLKIANRVAETDSNVDAYTFKADQWQPNESTYDSFTGKRSFSTTQVGSYAAFAMAMPTMANAIGSDADAMYSLGRAINITDMPVFDPNALLTPDQLNQFVAAVAQNKKSFEMNGFMTPEESLSLTRRGLAVNGSSLTKEQAVNTLVKLYELKTQRPVTPYSTVANTNLQDIQQADAQYRNQLLKASELGFFRDADNANPKAQMTMGDLIYMMNIIVNSI